MASLLHRYQNPAFADQIVAWYEGVCPMTKELCRLPRTGYGEAIARQLMEELAMDDRFSWEGKMYGVLLVETPTGERFYLKAFSGLLQGQKNVPGWVPPIDGGDRLILQEQEILAQLREIRRRIAELESLPQRQTLQTLSAKWLQKIDQFNVQRRHSKKQRQQQRRKFAQNLAGEQLKKALDQLEEESRQESNEKRDLKQARNQELGDLRDQITLADNELAHLRQRRKTLSRDLQKQMHRVYSLKNFAGASQAIADLSSQGLPTGTGECCAPKLLSYAAKHQLKPLTLAEFWWGKKTAEKTPGNFYPACAERCQPILGFLLSGLEKKTFSEIITTPEVSLEILYEDDDLLAINKPAGLPSIPGRSSHNYDSAFSRLKRDLDQIFLVHRLDQDTSGVLLFAKNPDTQQQLQTQFRRRQIVKIYNALLEKPCIRDEGIIDLPICPDPGDRPRQKVDLQQGKPSQTSFKKIHENHIELKPITGRTHQLRVHCAHPQGLGNPILGDRLYGSVNAPKLHLHATSIALEHPQTKQKIYICKTVSF